MENQFGFIGQMVMSFNTTFCFIRVMEMIVIRLQTRDYFIV